MESLISKKEFFVIGRKTTICLITLKNGFEIVGTSDCVIPEDFDKSLGEKYAEEDALRILGNYYGFKLQEEKFLLDSFEDIFEELLLIDQEEK